MSRWLAGAAATVAGMLVAWLPPGRGVAVIAGVAAVVGGAALPAYTPAIIAFAVPFGDLAALPLGGGVGATEAGVALVGAAWLARSAQRRRLDLGNNGLLFPLSVFLGVAALSAAGAPSFDPAAKELAKWLEFGLMAAMAYSMLSGTRPAFVAVAALLTAGTLEAAYGVYQAVSASGPAGFLLGAGTLRAFGNFGQPNPYAAYLGSVLVLAAGIILAFAARDRSSLRSPLVLAVVAAAACISYGVLASFSRSAWIALVIAFSAMLTAHDRRMAAVLALAAAGTAALAVLGAFDLLPPVMTSRFAVLLDNFTLFDAREVTLTSANFPLVQRMAIWQAAWEMFQEHPILGAGLGNFDVAYRNYALPGWPQLPGHAHNYYLNLLAEGGILLLGSYLALLGSLYYLVFKAVRRLKRSVASHPSRATVARYGVTLGGAGLLVLLTVHHLFDNLYVHGMLAQTGLILGLSLAVTRMPPEHDSGGATEMQ